MIHQNLPSPDLKADLFAESSKNHVFFSTTIGSYHYPQHETPYLLIANFRETGNYILNGRKMTVSDNHFYLLNPGDRLEIDFKQKHGLRTFLVAFDEKFIRENFHLATRTTERLLDNPAKVTSGSFSVPSVPFSMNAEITGLLYGMLKFPNEDEILTEILISFFQLLDETEGMLSNLKAVKRMTREEIYRRLFLSEEFIRDHLSEEVSLDEMASSACLNSFHFLKLFKELFHTTPHQYLTKLRLKKAYAELRDGHISVTAACHSAGFQSPASFSHLFKKRYGCSPSELLK